MNANSNTKVTPGQHEDQALADVLRQALLRLAAAEDVRAADEAARTRYWEPVQASVLGRRTAASVLRAEADRIAAGRLLEAS